MKLKCTFASTRPVQIATRTEINHIGLTCLCLHTPRADCNARRRHPAGISGLCLHTPRADCNDHFHQLFTSVSNFASTRPVQIATNTAGRAPEKEGTFASTRPVQIATEAQRARELHQPPLPPHAPCRLQPGRWACPCRCRSALPPHAPCRLQRASPSPRWNLWPLPPHAPCRLQQAPKTEE